MTDPNDPLDTNIVQPENDISALRVLPKLPPAPWRSLGGYLDYSCWKERARFLELDAAIARLRQTQQDDAETDLPGL